MSSESDSSVEDCLVDSESEKFDPIKALYTTNRDCLKNVHVYDNVQQFENYINLAKKGKLGSHLALVESRKKQHTSGARDGDTGNVPPASGAPSCDPSDCPPSACTTTSQASTSQFIMPGRQFTTDQAPVIVQRKQLQTVITKMSTMCGPLACVKRYVDMHLKVKVVTRGSVRVRGQCVGYIVAFDKHWNMCLTDVDETYTRAVRRKLVHLGPSEDQGSHPVAATSECGALGKQVVVQVQQRPATTGGSRRRPLFETVNRHINQLFIRGDNVVTISCSRTPTTTIASSTNVH